MKSTVEEGLKGVTEAGGGKGGRFGAKKPRADGRFEEGLLQRKRPSNRGPALETRGKNEGKGGETVVGGTPWAGKP